MITWLAENSDDEHLKKVKQNAEQHAVKMEVASRSVHDEKALFDEDDNEEDEEVVEVKGKDKVKPEDEFNARLRSLHEEAVRVTAEGTAKSLQDFLMSPEVEEGVTVIITRGMTLTAVEVTEYMMGYFREHQEMAIRQCVRCVKSVG